MPVVFVAHGSPMLALDAQKGKPLTRWGVALPRPRSILAVSAHWEEAPVTLGAEATAPLVYDFYGFPAPLYAVEYASPGAPELAQRVARLLGGEGNVRRSGRGIDHGVWTPLVHMYPGADVPVLQLSMPSSEGAARLFALGRALAPLRDEGVLILGSGNLVHNLRRLDRDGAGAPPPAWAAEFDAWIGDACARRDFDTMLAYQTRAPGLDLAHPTKEHFLPILVTAGAAADNPGAVTFPVMGWEHGSLSRRSVQFA